MKIRAITIGVSLSQTEFADGSYKLKLKEAHDSSLKLKLALEENQYEVQTTRISLNSFEEWLVPVIDTKDPQSLKLVVSQFQSVLEELEVNFCSIGPCHRVENIPLIPVILSLASRVSCTVQYNSDSYVITPNFSCLLASAQCCLDVAHLCGNLGNFRFAIGFNCPSGTPFFPVAYHSGSVNGISIGLENGDLVNAATAMATDHQNAKELITEVFEQALLPVQEIVEAFCLTNSIVYQGIDASINPALTMEGSVGQALENLIPDKTLGFGSPGTLAAVSTVTAGVKGLLASGKVKLTGYSGLMLPVMEDLVLADRANATSATTREAYNLRDLLVYSSVCGVGLDTIPIPGESDPNVLAGIYSDVAALSYRLQKPLSCRLLPMLDQPAGDLTTVQSPYLCNTKIFPLR